MKLIILARIKKGKIVAGTLSLSNVQNAQLEHTALTASIKFKCDRQVKQSGQIVNPSKFLTPSQYRKKIDPTLPENIVNACESAICLKHFWIFEGSANLV